jgi:hypothetical protein
LSCPARAYPDSADTRQHGVEALGRPCSREVPPHAKQRVHSVSVQRPPGRPRRPPSCPAYLPPSATFTVNTRASLCQKSAANQRSMCHSAASL